MKASFWVVSLAVSSLTLSARAKPGWADAADRNNEQGHTFTCEGQGASDTEAIAVAKALCNDKICKVCGVEVESIVETRETLKGIDMQRKVIERCRRVRKHETKVRYKSVDCGPEGCTAWIQVLYTQEDERAECPAYTQDNFADPAACERDIEAFKTVQGRTSESFRQRAKILTDALSRCEGIDVRPTPAILALNTKLAAGMDAFEFTERKQQARLETPFFDTTWYKSREDMMQRRGLDDTFLTTYLPLRQQIAEAKLLTDRIALIRGYVANKALVFALFEALRAKDLQTPAGIARLLAAMKNTPVGAQYGAPNAHFVVPSSLYRAKVDTTPIAAFMMHTYPPEERGFEEAFEMAKFLDDDGRTSEEEWDYLMRAHTQGAHGCLPCLRVAIAAPEHGTPEKRLEHLLAALATLPAKERLRDRRHQLKELLPLNDPLFVIAALPHLPDAYRAAADLSFFDELTSRLGYSPAPNQAAAVVGRVVQLLAHRPTDVEGAPTSPCRAIASRLDKLERYQAHLAPLDGAVCSCLKGELKAEPAHSWLKSQLMKLAQERKLPCAR